MIGSFQHQGLRQFFETGSRAGICPAHAERLRLQLAALAAATGPDDVDLPDYDLRQLGEDQAGRWSIAVHTHWRLTFEFRDEDVHVVDYEEHPS